MRHGLHHVRPAAPRGIVPPGGGCPRNIYSLLPLLFLINDGDWRNDQAVGPPVDRSDDEA